MKIELYPVTHEFNDCFQGQVETIVEGIYHKNYLLTQLYRWTTIIDIVEGQLKVIMEKDYLNTDELSMLGLKQVIIKCADKTEAKKRIKEELKNGLPVIAGIQISNCPWDPNYKKEFIMKHMIIINGMDDKEENFICCDSTYEICNGLLPMEEFEAGYTGEYRKIIEFDKNKNLEDVDFEMLLIRRAEELAKGPDKHFQRLERVANYLKNNADVLNIHEDHLDNVLFSKNYMMIRNCAKVREMLAVLINQFVGSKWRNCANLFEICMNKWLKLRILYVRAATSKKQEYELLRMAKQLYEIKAFEEDIVRYILGEDICTSRYLDNKFSQYNSEISANSLSIHTVDLSPYFNNKAFGNYDYHEKAAFTELGEYMLRPKDGIRIPIFEGETYEISIPNGNDNIICNGQIIPVNLRNVVEIVIIGTTEYCTGQEELTIASINGTNKSVAINFPEWYTEILSKETLVLKQTVIAKEKDQIMYTSFSGKIFLKRFLIHDNNNISNIVLPKGGRIHIFQILSLTNEKSATK